NQAILDGPDERRGVPPLLTPDGIDGVQVAVEMEQGQAALGLAAAEPGGPDVGVRDGVVAADGEELGGFGISQGGGELAGGVERALDGIGLDGGIAGIGEAKGCGDIDVVLDGVALNVLGGVADGARAEARARAVRDATVEGDAVEGPVYGRVFGRDGI